MRQQRTKTVLVTGGCGFIGSSLLKRLLNHRPEWRMVNVDLLTYAGNPANLTEIERDPRYVFVKGDIADFGKMRGVFETYTLRAVINCAAETHVDRSLESGVDFVKTNVLGTQVLFELARIYESRFVQVSSDEVYGSLGRQGSLRKICH